MKKVLLIACIVSSVSVYAQKVTKKVALVKGDQLTELAQVNVFITQEAMGQLMEIKMESSVTNVVDVKEKADNAITVANTLTKVLLNMDAMGQEMKFDSDKKEDLDGQMGAAYRDKINKPREYMLDNNGVVKEVKTKEEVKADDGSQMFGNMGGAMYEDKEGNTFSALANLPAAGASVGDSWQDSSSAEGTRTVTKYTLKEVKGNDGIIGIDSDLTISREMEQQGMNMQMELKGKTEGEYLFDVNTGIIKSRKLTTKTEGNIEVMGQLIPMSMETTTVSNITKK